MARISTYTRDATISDGDQLIGTDSGTGRSGSSGATKNFQLSELRKYFIGDSLSEGFVPVFNENGNFGNSNIRVESQIVDGVSQDFLTISGNVRFSGNIQNQDGNDILDDRLNEVYQTAVHQRGANLDPYTIHVFTQQMNGSMYNLPADPPDGTWVKIVNLSGVSNVILNAGTGGRFMNFDIQVLQLDDRTASFELIYINKPAGNSPVGWVIVGAN